VISGYYKIIFADGTPLQAIDLPQLVLTLPTPSGFTFAGAQMAAGTAFVQVLARAGGNTPQVDSQFATRAIAKLAAPSGVTFTVDATGSTLTATWNNVSAATSYVVSVSRGTSAVATASVPQSQAAMLTQSWPVAAFSSRAPGTYSVAVQASAGTSSVPSDPTVSASIYLFPAPPTNVSLGWDAGTLSVYWTPATLPSAGPVTYHIRLYDDAAATHLVGELTGQTAPGVAITRTDPAAFATGQSYRAAVATVAGPSAGAFSTASPAFPIFDIPLPTIGARCSRASSF
jgi:hypothetical protein